MSQEFHEGGSHIQPTVLGKSFDEWNITQFRNGFQSEVVRKKYLTKTSAVKPYEEFDVLLK